MAKRQYYPASKPCEMTITINATKLVKRVGLAVGGIVAALIGIPILVVLMLAYGNFLFHIGCYVIGANPNSEYHSDTDMPSLLAFLGTIVTFGLAVAAIVGAIVTE